MGVTSRILQWRGLAVQPPSVTRWMLLISSSLLFVRVFVLFCESYSAVHSERVADDRLLELCARGAASDSTKFRQLCLQAKADRAAPLVFKAILKAIKTTFSDFTESFNSPARIAALVLFCLSGLALPVVKAVSSIATAYLGPSALHPFARLHGLHGLHAMNVAGEEEQEACEVMVLNGGKGGGSSSWANRLRRLPRRFAGNRLTMHSLNEGGESDEDDASAMFTSVKLGQGLA